MADHNNLSEGVRKTSESIRFLNSLGLPLDDIIEGIVAGGFNQEGPKRVDAEKQIDELRTLLGEIVSGKYSPEQQAVLCLGLYISGSINRQDGGIQINGTEVNQSELVEHILKVGVPVASYCFSQVKRSFYDHLSWLARQQQ